MGPSEDEILALAFSSVIAVGAWGWWYFSALTSAQRISARADRSMLISSPIVAIILLIGFLALYADREVRTSPFYIGQYAAMGMAWVGVGMFLVPLLGVSTRDDVIERRNHAAAQVFAGAILGLMFCYAGGNIGDGPGWWVVVLCALLASAAWFALWLIVELVGHISESVTVERSITTGVRFNLFLQANGLILGRAVAGDWVDVPGTLRDFVVVGWPVVVLLAAELLRQSALRPGRPRAVIRLNTSTDLFIGALYLAVAIGYIIALGWWT